MRDDRSDPAIAQLQKTIGRLRGHAVIAQLHQHVTRILNRIARRIGQYVLQILIRKMKVAAQQQLQIIPNQPL